VTVKDQSLGRNSEEAFDAAAAGAGQEHLRRLFEAAPVALIAVDGAALMGPLNAEAERLFGYGPGELEGRPLATVVPAAARGIAALRAGRDQTGLRKDGSELAIEIALGSVATPLGTFELAAIAEGGERKRAARLLALGTEFGRHALATNATGRLKQDAADLVAGALGVRFVRIAELDSGGNATFDAGVGWPAKSLDDPSVEVELEPQFAECVRTGKSIFVEGGEHTAASATIPIRLKDAVVGLLHAGAPEGRKFSSDEIAFLIGVGTMLGMAIERERREQRIADLNLELQHRYDELETFSYSVAHDLRSPLRSVAGFASALDEDFGDVLDEEAKRFIGLIIAGSNQMGHLIDALLSLSRVSRQEISRGSVDLTTVARSVVSNLQAGEPDRNAIVMIAPDLCVTGDPVLLRTVVQNLLANAWKFTRGMDPAIIGFATQIVDGKTVFSVKDNGVGFATEYPDQIFAPFKRLHGKKFEGTGIGLATVARIIRRHGGRVWAQSQPGAGAQFFFTLGDERAT
jgi:PAS domain S-box-containing protein